eukprot:6180524-Pleurochrysis_carterae.AAC.9
MEIYEGVRGISNSSLIRAYLRVLVDVRARVQMRTCVCARQCARSVRACVFARPYACVRSHV